MSLSGRPGLHPCAAVGRARLAARLLVATVALLATLAVPALALAASPVPSAGTGADTRSAGQGPGLVGAPGQAILLVLLVAAVAVVVTLAYVRLTASRQPPST